ncbi:DUF1580 domain-containing protein [Gemmata obscuriglobus]|uniref:DUF1580 domain-containing protein n=2 Tax=Gemmata obscuriglobus TaxID=114 RepID=A0A2Z3HCG1_9BACT|nr:DUF1580 domain-containing protein [Gemmata obscuriglobus]AWM39364.1 DUF1580 domain-containing protein [Gemmata obscuriglobus]
MTMSEAGAFIKRDALTLRRWVSKGIRGIKLEAVKVGKSLVTSREAVTRFIAATNTTHV